MRCGIVYGESRECGSMSGNKILNSRLHLPLKSIAIPCLDGTTGWVPMGEGSEEATIEFEVSAFCAIILLKNEKLPR